MIRTIWMVICLFASVSFGSMILLIPCDHHSHVNFFTVAATSLRDAGHDVRVLTMERNRKTLDKKGVAGMFHHSEKAIFSGEFSLEDAAMEGKEIFGLFEKVTTLFNDQCVEIMENVQLMKDIEKYKFDLILVDGFDPARCLYVIPYYLNVRYITLTARHDPWNARIPSLPSVEALPMSPLSPNSTLWERLKNTAFFIFLYYKLPLPILNDDMIVQYVPSRPQVTFADLFRQSEMWLVNLETMCLDWPKVHGLHYQFVSGLGCEPAEPLPDDLEDFTKGAPKGVIVVSFGSGLKKIPLETLNKMLEVFKLIKHRVVMRYDGDIPANIPANVKLLPWLPQNDLLGHQKTKLFITHAGNNGQMEALYHGVPMLAMPFFGDQLYNAKRSKLHGYGLTIDPHKFTIEELLSTILEMTSNKKYSDAIRSCSMRFRSFPSSRDTLTFWVEHVIRFGGSHLKPPHIDMPLWKFFMLDILLLVFVTVLAVCACCIWAVVWIRRKCCTSKSAGKPKKEMKKVQ